MHKRHLLLLLCLLFVKISTSQNFEKTVSGFVQQDDYKNAAVGMHFVDLESGETLYERNAQKLFIPASTMKLVSSAAALSILGPDYRFNTLVGYRGKINNTALQGDLVVIGGGDPVLGSDEFANHYYNFLVNWARELRTLGIQKVSGDLVLDISIYDKEYVPPTWVWEDIGNYYGAGAHALSVYDNLFRISFQSPSKAGRKTKIVSTYPKIKDLHIRNEVLSADNNSDNAYVYGSPFDKSRIIRGTIPKNRKVFTIKAAVHQPHELLAREFIRCLAEEGIFIEGEIRLEKVNRRRVKKVVVQESPSLADIAKVLNYESVNLIAEHLVKQIAYEKSGFGTREKGLEEIEAYFKNMGIPLESLFMEDGSGLSHFNAVSPKFFTDLLTFMNSHKANSAFYNSLPPAGKGTLSRFDQNTFPGNSLKAKSGSMTRVRCYAGYLELDSGKKAAFAIMVNHFSGSHSQLVGQLSKLLQAAQTRF